MAASPLPVVRRHAYGRVVEALADTRVVVVQGARQVGKSTLVQSIARERGGWSFETFDEQVTRTAAEGDPTGFVASLRLPAVIDEIQRVPDVLLAIKQHVDREQAPGQFLLTGSANILTAPGIADALTGRTEYVRLGPFTQSELRARTSTFLDSLFAGDVPWLVDQPVGRAAYAPVVAAGGYPEAVKRADGRRGRFFDDYVGTVLDRDLRSLAAVSDTRNVHRLLAAVAALSASELNYSSLGRDLGLTDKTLRGYVDLLETLFLVRRLPPWSSNLLSRTVRAPKVHIADSGLLTALIGGNAERVTSDLQLGGPLFESFVAMELAREIDVHETQHALYHFRDRDQREVDLVIERRDGSLVAVEVKAAASVHRRDLRGLQHLRDRLGPRLVAGVLLYTGASTVAFGDRLAAVPISAIWGGFDPARLSFARLLLLQLRLVEHLDERGSPPVGLAQRGDAGVEGFTLARGVGGAARSFKDRDRGRIGVAARGLQCLIDGLQVEREGLERIAGLARLGETEPAVVAGIPVGVLVGRHCFRDADELVKRGEVAAEQLNNRGAVAAQHYQPLPHPPDREVPALAAHVVVAVGR